jgi:hypothetical protein
MGRRSAVHPRERHTYISFATHAKEGARGGTMGSPTFYLPATDETYSATARICSSVS